MANLITQIENLFGSIPLPFLEIWGRFAYLIGLTLAVCAFGGFTFRIGPRWGFGRERQAWTTKSFLSIPLTCVLVIVSGYVGSSIVLVPGAQTFESLKDLVVLLCVVIFGYPALLAVPPAYMLSDLIEGVPPGFVLSWAEAYFAWTAFVWLACQFFGRNPDFRRLPTWGAYGIFAVLLMLLDPVMWGFICSNEFTSAISYRNISSALSFTLLMTIAVAPVAFLIALPVARKFGWFWAEIPGHVSARAFGPRARTWVSGHGDTTGTDEPDSDRLPIRIYIFSPFVGLVLLMVGATAIVALGSASNDFERLAMALHRAESTNVRLQLDRAFAAAAATPASVSSAQLVSTLREELVTESGRAFLVDEQGAVVASSSATDDPIVANALSALIDADPTGVTERGTSFRFDHLTETPLSRETWLAHASSYRTPIDASNWILVSAMPESFYLAGALTGNSRAAMVFAIALVLSLLLAAALASAVTAPLRRLADSTHAVAGSKLGQRVPGSRVQELHALTESFNHMSSEINDTFHDLITEVERRRLREQELEQSEARLRLSEERLHLAIEGAGVGIWDWNIEEDRLIWDDSMYRLYGVTREQFSGAYDAWARCLIPEDADQANRDVEKALHSDQAFRSDFRIRRNDGKVRTIRGLAQAIREADGRAIRMVGICRDVTELMEAEQEKEKLLHALKSRVEELGLLHKTARLLQANRRFDQGLFEQLVELIPTAWQFPESCKARISYRDIEVASPGWRETRWIQSASFVSSGGAGGIEVAYTEEHPDADFGPFLAFEQDLLESIAEMLVNYLELSAYQEHLEELVATRTEKLRTAREVAESANRAKTAFLANMSHEIRTPMNAILGYAQLLRRSSNLDDEQVEKIDVIRSSGEHLLKLINDILQMSKIEAGHSTLAIDPLHLHDLMDELHSMFRELARRKGLTLRFITNSELPTKMSGDARRIRQVLINLLSNAIKFTEKGGIEVYVSTQAQLNDTGHLVSIAVEDSGTGIKAENLERIFDPFEQESGQSRSQGTGLGLAISRGFARLMGGDIHVRSKRGKGSCFTFTFEAGSAMDTHTVEPDQQAIPVRPAADERTLNTTGSMRKLPPALIDKLREAAIQGRTRQLEILADQANEHSVVAAKLIRFFTRKFSYDAILAALDSESDDSAPD